MLLRLFSAALAIAALIGSAHLSRAPADNERFLMLGGGAPRSKNYNLFGFGGTDTTKTRVNYSGKESPGTIVINTAERKLYLVEGDGNALQYGVGVGRIGFTWKGTHKITSKKEWPSWTPPAEMRARVRGLPAHMAGGIEKPPGARAMYPGSTLYLIHCSTAPEAL